MYTYRAGKQNGLILPDQGSGARDRHVFLDPHCRTAVCTETLREESMLPVPGTEWQQALHKQHHLRGLDIADPARISVSDSCRCGIPGT